MSRSAKGTPLTRRDFIQHASIAVLIAPRFVRTTRLRVHCVLPAARTDLINGVLLGAEEAQHTASLVSASVDLLRHEVADDLASLALDGLSAIVGGHDTPSLMSLAARAGGRVALLNTSATDDDLRRSLCDASVFHIAPSDAMLSRASTDAKSPGARVAAWHPSLFRYGAEQLNDRYRARFPGAP